MTTSTPTRERYVRTSLQQSPWFSYIGSSHGYAWSRTPIRLKPEPGPKYHGNICRGAALAT